MTDSRNRSGMGSEQQAGFTIVELLVVVACLAILIAMLLPALRRAREIALQTQCASTMRQALVAIAVYNQDYPGVGLTNYLPTCQFWGQPFSAWSSLWTDHEKNGGNDVWDEGRIKKSSWRGYLLAGKYADSTVLGCPAHDFTGETFNASYNDAQGNFMEPDGQGPTFRKNPCYVWYGPGIIDWENVAQYSGGNIGGRKTSSFHRRDPLLTCPQVHLGNVAPTGDHWFVFPHRSNWVVIKGGELSPLPYAENIGFTDGSVQWYVSRGTNWYAVPNYVPLKTTD
ncbi:MAG TPA: type II secretion system protein [Tepidisphaeraceae bacterium]